MEKPSQICGQSWPHIYDSTTLYTPIQIEAGAGEPPFTNVPLEAAGVLSVRICRGTSRPQVVNVPAAD